MNTYEHHEATIRGSARPERNMLKSINGDFGRLDRGTFSVLESVLA